MVVTQSGEHAVDPWPEARERLALGIKSGRAPIQTLLRPSCLRPSITASGGLTNLGRRYLIRSTPVHQRLRHDGRRIEDYITLHSAREHQCERLLLR